MMHCCDTCRYWFRCYGKRKPAEIDLEYAEVELGGCPTYKELTIKEMFLKDAKSPKKP